MSNHNNNFLQKIFLKFEPRDLSQTMNFPDLLTLELLNVAPAPTAYESDRVRIVIFGHPIIGDSINPSLLLEKLIEEGPDFNFLANLNGEFLIFYVDKPKGHLYVINDRFASLPFYYRQDRTKLYGSYSFNELWLYLKKENLLSIKSESFYELLMLRRLLSVGTHDANTCCMPPASCLSFDGKKLAVNKYWQQSYTKIQASKNDLVMSFIDAVKHSIALKTSDNKRYGLFLSGGMDTRTVLSGFTVPLVCFTATSVSANNREFEVAQKLAQSKNCRHVHLQFPDQHNSLIYMDAVRQAGAMYEPNSIFMGFRDQVAKEIDVAFHGHGFDYMFQGMYIPCQRFSLFGRQLRARKLYALPKDLVSEFLQKISYRLKYPYVHDHIYKQWHMTLQDYIRADLESLLLEAKALSSDPFDHWEYLTFHSLSRHYSYSDHASIQTNVEQRSITFENGLYDLYHSLPVHYRFDARLMREALKCMNHTIAKIPSANDGYPICSSSMKTVYQLRDAALNRLGLRKVNTLPSHLQRTWPTHDWLIRNERYFYEKAKNLGPNSPIAALEWLDMKAIRSRITDWLLQDDKIDHLRFGDFVWNLIGINQFLEQG